MSAFTGASTKSCSLKRSKTKDRFHRMAKPKLGLDKYRGKRITARYTNSEYDELIELSKRVGVSPSELVHRLSIKAKLEPRFTEEQEKTYRELVSMANNLNQLSHLAHRNGINLIEFEAKKMFSEIAKIIIKYKSGR